MKYEALKTFTLDDEFAGWLIVSNTPKGDLRIEGNWIYVEEDLDRLNQQLEFLNTSRLVKEHWPDPDDPDVLKVLEGFPPAEMEHVEVIDGAKSMLVLDTEGAIDEASSSLVYKTVLAPSPSAEFERINQACEVVARERAGLTSAN